MNNNHRLLPGGPWRAFTWLALGLLISACEAPLDLTLVEREIEKPIYRFDQLKAAASNHRRIIAVGDYGTLLTSLDKGKTWQRTQLPTKSSLISVASCEDGSFAAIDTVRKVWLSDAQGSDWRAQQLETMESPMAISCDPRRRFWIAASFSTLIHSDESQGNWREISQQE
ncbi:MAG: glycosyl hydrolase, partial [Candidatus Thiodiazotropha endolucinida]|nr:glycosyl hydrolase [Candidatus Thiodiazotropha taylori]MCW4247006.1 glycosyl hydrolase [Candidatus Thiodiazotropha endolucinida]